MGRMFFARLILDNHLNTFKRAAPPGAGRLRTSFRDHAVSGRLNSTKFDQSARYKFKIKKLIDV